jgi:hypothetical protein
MYERLQKNKISLSDWAMMFDCDHTSEVCMSGQKVGCVSEMHNMGMLEEELKKTVLRCADCHKVKTNFFGEGKQIKPLVSEDELKGIQECKGCENKKRVVFFVSPCKMMTGQLRKYKRCNACRQKCQDFFIILAHEKLEFVEQYQGMTLV